MKKSRILLLAIFALLMLVLSACVPGPRVVGTPGLALSEEMVFVSYQNFVFALNAETGSIEWQYPEEANNQVVFYAPPLVTEDYIYVGDLANNFHKIDIETGAAEWTFSDAKGLYMGQAAEDDGVIYAPSNDGNLYAIDADGKLLWAFETEHYIWAQPQVTDNAIFVGSMDHFVYALSKDGKELWSTEMLGAVVGSPKLSEEDGLLFVGSLGREIVALDTQNGEQVWRFDAGGSLESVWGSPLVLDGSLYFADSGGKLVALDVKNGSPLWQTEFDGSVVGGVASIGDGIALVTGEGLIKAFNFDGSPKWEATLEGESFQAPVANDALLVVGTINSDNLLYAFNLAGVQLWSTTPEN